jgi:hypothetical protein
MQEFFDFKSHQFNPFTVQDLQFYHVYDGLSQTPHIPGSGIQAGDINVYLMRYCHRITLASITKHYNWGQREPTSFISLFDKEECARNEAHRRAHHNRVFDPATDQWRIRGYVAIAVISGAELALQNTFIFSSMDLISEHMLGQNSRNSLLRHWNPREWFVMDFIPEAAITRTIPIA